MRVNALVVSIVIVIAALSPMASADLGAREGFAVYITFPHEDYNVGSQVDVTVHVFYQGEYHDADEVALMVDWPGDRMLDLSNGSTGMYNANFTIEAGDVRDWSGRLTLEASAAMTDIDGVIYASDRADLYLDGTQMTVSLYRPDPRDRVPRPGDELNHLILVRNEYGPVDLDEGYPMVEAVDRGTYQTTPVETSRLDVGTYAFSFRVGENLTRSTSYRVEVDMEKTVGPVTYQVGGYFNEDVDVLDVWARIVSSTPESTELELMAVDERGRAIPEAVFELSWDFYNSSGWWEQYDHTWTSDHQGTARVVMETPDLDDYYVGVEGQVAAAGLVQEIDRTIPGHTTTTYRPDPFDVRDDVEGSVLPGERRTITHNVTYEGKPLAGEEMYVYYTDEHHIYHHGKVTTDAQGQFEVTIDVPADLRPDGPWYSDWINGQIQWWNLSDSTGFPHYLPPNWYDGDVTDLADENLTVDVRGLHPGRTATVVLDHPEADGQSEDCIMGWRIVAGDNWTRWVYTTSGYSMMPCEWTDDAYEGSLDLPLFVTEDMEIEVFGALLFIEGMFDTVVRNYVDGFFPVVIPPDPPGAPRALAAVQDIDKVTLAWQAPADDGGSIVSGYVVYRGTSSDALEVLATTDHTRAYVDTTIDMGQTYHYAVAAVTAAGEGAACDPFMLETIEYRAPSPPLNLSDRFDRRRVYLEWDPPEDEGGQPVTHYTVLRGDGPDGLEEVGNTTLRTYTDSSVEVGRYYHYAIKATNLVGTGEPCEARRVRADYIVVPPPPGEVTAHYRDQAVVVNWSVPVDDGGDPLTGYVLMRGSGPLELEPLAEVGLVTTYVDTDIEPGVMYYYTVSAVNGIGTGDPSTKATVQVPAIDPPSAPTGVTVEFVVDRAKVSWQPPEDDGGSPVTGYRVLRGAGGGILEELAVVTVGITYFDLQVERGQTYAYVITAMNVEEESGPSEEATLRVPKPTEDEGWTMSWYVFGALAAAAVAVLVAVFVLLRRWDGGGTDRGREGSSPPWPS